MGPFERADARHRRPPRRICGERQAADYIASVFESCGAAVTVESFPVRERAVTSETLDLLIGSAWHRHPCSLLSNAPGTAGRVIEAPIALIDAATGYQRDDLSALAGKAVIHLGTHIESPDHYRRLMPARPAFLMFVDTRYPADAVTADGIFPAYVHRFGAVPTVSMVYQDAWNGYAAAASAARLCVAGGMATARHRTSSPSSRGPIHRPASSTSARITTRRPAPSAPTTTGQGSRRSCHSLPRSRDCPDAGRFA